MTIPQQLLNSLKALPGFNEAAFVAAHEDTVRITSIRLNPFKKARLDFELGQPVPWADDAFYLTERPSFTFDPLFHAGAYYVQEAGSIFITHALKSTLHLQQDLKVLDLCAAPGGKSTLVNSLLSTGSLLVSNELIKNRAEILVQNLARWGTANTIVTNSDAQRFSALGSFFDALIIDAPCSGSGLFRKQPEAIDEWSEDNVKLCSSRQRDILSNALPALKEDGILIYSTCSYSVQENEDIVRWLQAEQQMEYVPLSVPEAWGLVDTGLGYRFYPHLTASEGFFCAVLRKKEMTQPVYTSRKKINTDASKAELALLSGFIRESESLVLKKNNQFHLLNQAALEFLSSFEKQFYFKKAGILLGEIKGTDVVPNQELAWSGLLGEKVNRMDLDKDTALLFLRKDNFLSPAGQPKGLALVSYKQLGIGWAKVLPNRINNYLPPEMRILSRKP